MRSDAQAAHDGSKNCGEECMQNETKRGASAEFNRTDGGGGGSREGEACEQRVRGASRRQTEKQGKD